MENGEVTYGVLRVVFYDATPYRLHPQGSLQDVGAKDWGQSRLCHAKRLLVRCIDLLQALKPFWPPGKATKRQGQITTNVSAH